REHPGAFWTGTGLVVWGGNDTQSQPAWDGARYNPTSNTWAALPAAPLAPRLEASTAWDGHALFVWGGTTDDESRAIPQITPATDGSFRRLGGLAKSRPALRVTVRRTDRLQDTLGRHRDDRRTDADGVAHGVGDRAGAGDRRRLADTLRPERTVGRRDL